MIGRVFWEAAVEAIGQQSLETAGVGEVLNRLRHRGLVHRRRQSSFAGTGEFVFKHALLRDVTYDSLLKTHRSDYHRRAAKWMEDVAESTRRGDQYAGLIARHHELAGSDAPAASWYRRAGAHAASVFALAEATRLATNGLELVTDERSGSPIRPLGGPSAGSRPGGRPPAAGCRPRCHGASPPPSRSGETPGTADSRGEPRLSGQ